MAFPPHQGFAGLKEGASSGAFPCAGMVLIDAIWMWGELGCWRAADGMILPVAVTGEADCIAGRGGFI